MRRGLCPSRFGGARFAVLLGAMALTGCTGSLATMMTSTPNRINPYVGPGNPIPPMERWAGTDEQFLVKVGPPEAYLSVGVIEPPPAFRPPRGTVLVIHGVFARSFWMLQRANSLAEAGYRAVLVDLRGHGRSTGEHLGYGLQEAKDLSQVIDVLAQRRLLTGRLGVCGISYGATTSIHLAAYDRRVSAVVAVAPFSTMREAVPNFGRVMVPGIGAAIPEPRYQRAIDEAGRQAGFDPDEADATAAIQRTSAPVLILHGTDDRVVPPLHGYRLHEAARDHSELVLLPGLGHTTIWYDRDGEVARRSRDWFDRWL